MRRRWLLRLYLFGTISTWWIVPSHAAPPPALEQSLVEEGAESLARAARNTGDPNRGAVLFHEPNLACAKCHVADSHGAFFGPELSRPEKETTEASLIESVLQPSRVVRKGFETVSVETTDGKVHVGLVVSETDTELVLRDAPQAGRAVHIQKSDIDQRTTVSQSVMPPGLVNLLSDRQQFLDLIRYLIEIAEKGPARALELRPPADLYASLRLPEYETDLDHAGLISNLDGESYERGAAIYARVCFNCHGDKNRPGSLPTAPRFASTKLKNGVDPYNLYQTLTRGFGLMAPQTWMVPQQKYDVIHYLREEYLKQGNPTQYAIVTADYLRRLRKGRSRGPEPSNLKPWVVMDYGPTLFYTYGIPDQTAHNCAKTQNVASPGQTEGNGAGLTPNAPTRATGHIEPSGNLAHKGIAIRLDPGPGGIARGQYWALYDHDTMRLAAFWSGSGFTNWKGTQFNGEHFHHPQLTGTVHVVNRMGPAWANPADGGWDDSRVRGRDGLRYGPLPRDWGRYQGLYHYGNLAILKYTVGQADVLESPGYEPLSNEGEFAFSRTLNVGPSPHDLTLNLAPANVAVALVGNDSLSVRIEEGCSRVRIPAASTPAKFKVLLFDGDQETLNRRARSSPPSAALEPFTVGGPRRWPQTLETQPIMGSDDGPFAVDVLTHPVENPWLCQMRFTALDFFSDGRRAAVGTWDGDVWLVGGLDQPGGTLTWQRIASGLFQPLGLKIVDDRIHVACRDQIVILRDLNGDGETDFYECFNNDHQVTEHFHEFALDLQTDAAGNFYYAKAAQHAFPAIVPQHGTLLRVSRDGRQTDILATGFRAPNGVCVNGDGTFFVTDQEGFWCPKNRINHVKPGGFYGNMWGYHNVTDPSDEVMEQPLCWITNAFDRSPAEIVRVQSAKWGPLDGRLLNLSYGYGRVFVVPHEFVGGQAQGGMIALPIPDFPTGIMRGRFHRGDGQLYLCGMFSWAGSRTQPGGLYRVRSTGKPFHLPIGLRAKKGGLFLTFSDALDRASADDPGLYAIKVWSLKRSAEYGSPHIDEQQLKVSAASLSDDGRTLFLKVPDLGPTQCMEIRYALKTASGQPVAGVLHNTVHRIRD